MKVIYGQFYSIKIQGSSVAENLGIFLFLYKNMFWDPIKIASMGFWKWEKKYQHNVCSFHKITT